MIFFFFFTGMDDNDPLYCSLNRNAMAYHGRININQFIAKSIIKYLYEIRRISSASQRIQDI